MPFSSTSRLRCWSSKQIACSNSFYFSFSFECLILIHKVMRWVAGSHRTSLHCLLQRFYLSEWLGDCRNNIFFKWAIKKRAVGLPYFLKMVRRWCACYLNYHLQLFHAFLLSFQCFICQFCIPLWGVSGPQDHSVLIHTFSRKINLHRADFLTKAAISLTVLTMYYRQACFSWTKKK